MPPLETGHSPSQIWRDYLLHSELTITPSCALIRRDSALEHLVCGRIPHSDKRSKLHDCYMMIGALSARARTAWIGEPLAHLCADPGGITIDGLAAEDKGAALRDGYASLKAAWVRNAGGYR